MKKILTVLLITTLLISCSKKEESSQPVIVNNNLYYSKLEQAGSALENQNFDKAAKILSDAQVIAPALPMAYYMSGALEYQKGNFEAAGSQFRMALIRCDNEEKEHIIPEIDILTATTLSDEESELMTKAIAKYKNGEYEQAASFADTALTHNKGNVEALFIKGLGNKDQQIKTLESLLLIHPAHGDAIETLTRLYTTNKEYTKLSQLLQDRNEFYGEAAEVNHMLGEALYLLDKTDDAIIVLEHNNSDFSDFSPSYFLLGKIYFDQDAKVKAQEKLADFVAKKNSKDFTDLILTTDFDSTVKNAENYLKELKTL